MAVLRTVFAGPVTVAPSPVAGFGGAAVLGELRRFSLAFGSNASGSPYVGGYSVSGTVTIGAVPAARKVRLYFLHNGQLVAETWSDPVTGAYAFGGLELAEYYIWSEDYAREYDPVSHLVPLQDG